MSITVWLFGTEDISEPELEDLRVWCWNSQQQTTLGVAVRAVQNASSASELPAFEEPSTEDPPTAIFLCGFEQHAWTVAEKMNEDMEDGLLPFALLAVQASGEQCT